MPSKSASIVISFYAPCSDIRIRILLVNLKSTQRVIACQENIQMSRRKQGESGITNGPFLLTLASQAAGFLFSRDFFTAFLPLALDLRRLRLRAAIDQLASVSGAHRRRSRIEPIGEPAPVPPLRRTCCDGRRAALHGDGRGRSRGWPCNGTGGPWAG